jgi:hypothetical protein
MKYKLLIIMGAVVFAFALAFVAPLPVSAGAICDQTCHDACPGYTQSMTGYCTKDNGACCDPPHTHGSMYECVCTDQNYEVCHAYLCQVTGCPMLCH